jgi:hypothetical protein
MKKMTWLRGALALSAMAVVSTAFAADHLDAPGVMADPSTDITDLYTWMDGSNVIFALDVNPLASATATFSTTAQYVIHTGSITKLTDTPVATNIICTFASNTKISCWVGATGYVTGDPSSTTGLSSSDGKIKVFAGMRDDPFFFNLDGFHAAEAAVEAAASSLTLDAAGCPALSATTVTTLDKALSTNPNSTPPGGPAVDFFAGKNVLSIVLSIDKSLLTAGGPVVSAWASTNKGS